MSAMDIFNVAVGASTIISLILSIFATSKVLSIQATLKVDNREKRTNTTGNQTITGSGNNQAGGSIG
jgi:hypothetical protein